MKEFTYIIKDAQGIHARPAGMLAKCAKSCSSKIMIKKNDKQVEVTRLMAVMGLGVKQGETIVVEVVGENEEDDMKKMMDFFQENL